jgi:hypothetical protein
VLPGTSAAMAPGYENARQLAETKALADYWAKSPSAAPAPSLPLPAGGRG